MSSRSGSEGISWAHGRLTAACGVCLTETLTRSKPVAPLMSVQLTAPPRIASVISAPVRFAPPKSASARVAFPRFARSG
jgi:hypothetical protein